MRASFLQAYNSLPALSSESTIFTQVPCSTQELFLQTVGNLALIASKQTAGNVYQLINSYRGAYSNFLLASKYCMLCMESGKQVSNFVVLKLLERWVGVLEGLRRKKDLRLWEAVIEGMELGICAYEEFLVYLNYISTDLSKLVKTGTEQGLKKYGQNHNNQHLDANDLIKFLNVALPQVFHNIIVPRNFFPPTLLKSTDDHVDILYSNQVLENILQHKTHYNSLIKSLLKALLTMELEPSQTKELVLNAFKYYLLYQHDKKHGSSQIVIESLKKMTSPVRYALSDEISIFMLTLKKLGKELFVSYLSEKFEWIEEIVRNSNVFAAAKATIKPYYNQNFNNSLKVKVEAGKVEKYFIEVYERFSLLYFSLRCQQYDISIRFYYMGQFNQGEGQDQRKLLFASEKKEGTFDGSIEVVEKGIYMFELDNSYSWMKAKTVAIDLALFVPLEIKQHLKNKIKPIIFEHGDTLNEVPFENIKGWVEENEIKLNSTSADVTCKVENSIKVYNLKLIKNTGQAYEYETESKTRFLRKLKAFEDDPNVFWLIEGYKVQGIEQIQRWFQGEFEPERVREESREETKEKAQLEQQQQQQGEVQEKVEQSSKEVKIQEQPSREEQQPSQNGNEEKKANIQQPQKQVNTVEQSEASSQALNTKPEPVQETTQQIVQRPSQNQRPEEPQTE